MSALPTLLKPVDIIQTDLAVFILCQLCNREYLSASIPHTP